MYIINTHKMNTNQLRKRTLPEPQTALLISYSSLPPRGNQDLDLGDYSSVVIYLLFLIVCLLPVNMRERERERERFFFSPEEKHAVCIILSHTSCEILTHGV